MKKTQSKILSLALAVLLGLGVMAAPVTAQAADIKIQAGADMLTVNTSTVMFGGHEWVVIGNNSSGVTTANAKHYNLLLKNGDSGGGFPDSAFSMSTYNYENGELHQAMQDIYSGFAATGEQGLILARDLPDTKYGPNRVPLNNQYVWPLSDTEWNTIFHATQSSYVSELLKYGSSFWLRSPDVDYDSARIGAAGGGLLSRDDVSSTSVAVRPALSLNLSSVIFTSAAAGGKSDATVGSDLSAAKPLTGAVKFTVGDDDLDLGGVTPTAVSGRTVTFDYTGATAGKNLSAVVMDNSGEVKYYGKLATNTAATGTGVTVTVPDDFAATDTLQIFVEQCNDDEHTDFCSALVPMNIADQSAPTGIDKTDCTTQANSDGKITGVDTAMEYKLATDTNWTPINGTEVTGLEPGSYQVRVKGKVDSNTAHLASDAREVTVGAYTPSGTVATPAASPASGAVAAGTQVTLSCATSGATIHYTTDGSAPTTSSTVYSDPIIINAAMTIKAIAVKTGMNDSGIMTESYTISVTPPNTHIVTVTANPTAGGNPTATPTSAAAGTQITLAVNPNANYTFTGWTVTSPSGLSIADNSFIMPNEPVAITANYQYNQPYTPPSPSDSDSDSSYTQPAYTYGFITVYGVRVDYSVENATGILTLNLTRSQLDGIIEAAGGEITHIAFNLTGVSGVKGIDIHFPPAWFKEHPGVTFPVQTGIGGVHLNNSAAARFPAQDTTGTLSLRTGSVKLSARQSGKTVTWNSATAPITVYIPYPLKADTNASTLVMYDKATGKTIPHSFYANGRVYGAVNRPGEYEVKTVAASFTDTASHWAKDDIAFAVSHGLISGATETTFAPGTAITRADFLMALGKLSGADVSGYKQSGFTDVSNDNPAMPYIEWAAANKIVTGIGGGKFAPDAPITREAMALMMVNYAKATGQTLSATRQAVTFSDAAKISDWAKDAVKAVQQANIITGKPNNLFDPQGSTTRAEAAAILRRFAESAVNGKLGWVQTDKGAWQYIQSDYLPKTGWLSTTEGSKYYFDKDGFRVSGKWVQISGKWHYFYPDGKLAVSTKIDGYEVGADGARK